VLTPGHPWFRAGRGANGERLPYPARWQGWVLLAVWFITIGATWLLMLALRLPGVLQLGAIAVETVIFSSLAALTTTGAKKRRMAAPWRRAGIPLFPGADSHANGSPQRPSAWSRRSKVIS